MDCYYVDKTEHVRRLVEGGKYYFLSRPRRFGKTLLVDTLQELFEGSEELFRGLAIHDGWDWSARHPVVRISFGGGNFDSPDFIRSNLDDQLEETERLAGLEPGAAEASIRFRRLIRALHERTGQRTVVLVDEYDKPILDALGDRELALANRDFLRGFYAMIKDCDEQLHFVFLTGVSKLVGLFSGLNNLIDITLEPEFSDICGCTDDELDAVFAPELEGLDRDEIRRWYNGYNWRGPERLYNPFGLLLLFRRREFRPYWFHSGTPTFLVETLARRDLPTPDLDGMIGSESLLSTFDVDNISIEALLFQTGYLTIAGEEDGCYRLDYPNLEVRRSLGEALLEELLPVRGAQEDGAPAAGRTAGSERLRAPRDPVPRRLRRHPAPVVHEQPGREVRGPLRERHPQLLPDGGPRAGGRGQRQPGTRRHGDPRRRARLPVRVQGGGARARGDSARAAAGEGPCGQVPPPRAFDPPDRGGVQPGGAQRCRVRLRGRLKPDGVWAAAFAKNCCRQIPRSACRRPGVARPGCRRSFERRTRRHFRSSAISARIARAPRRSAAPRSVENRAFRADRSL